MVQLGCRCAGADAVLCLCSWGLVQPGILSVPELCHHMAEAWVSAAVLTSILAQYKQNNPGKVRSTQRVSVLLLWRVVCFFLTPLVLLCQFCIMTCTVFSCLAMVGRYIPGLVLSYSAGESPGFLTSPNYRSGLPQRERAGRGKLILTGPLEKCMGGETRSAGLGPVR